MLALSLASARLSKLCLNDLLDENLCKNLISFIFIFSLFFLVFTASTTAIDDVTN